MLRPAMNQIATHGESYYSVVIGVAKRARELSAEAQEEEMPLERKAVSSAIDEVYTGKLSIEHEEE